MAVRSSRRFSFEAASAAARNGAGRVAGVALSGGSVSPCLESQYHSARNKFERFREFLELISRFEFDFRRCENYIFEPIRILWLKVQSHATRLYMCMCCGLFAATQCCGVLDDSRVIYIYIFTYKHIFITDVPKKHETLWKVKGSCNRTSWKVSDVQIVRNTWVLSLSLCFCLCVLCNVCCVLCVVVVDEGGWRGEGERLTEPSGC